MPEGKEERKRQTNLAGSQNERRCQLHARSDDESRRQQRRTNQNACRHYIEQRRRSRGHLRSTQCESRGARQKRRGKARVVKMNGGEKDDRLLETEQRQPKTRSNKPRGSDRQKEESRGRKGRIEAAERAPVEAEDSAKRQ